MDAVCAKYVRGAALPREFVGELAAAFAAHGTAPVHQAMRLASTTKLMDGVINEARIYLSTAHIGKVSVMSGGERPVDAGYVPAQPAQPPAAPAAPAAPPAAAPVKSDAAPPSMGPAGGNGSTGFSTGLQGRSGLEWFGPLRPPSHSWRSFDLCLSVVSTPFRQGACAAKPSLGAKSARLV